MAIDGGINKTECCLALLQTDLEFWTLCTKHITIQWFTIFIDWWFPPSTGMVAKWTTLKKKLEGKIQQITITSLRGKCSGVTVKWNSSIVPYRSYYAKHYYLLHAQTSGMGALNPGIFRFGYDGGGPYLCMAINHGGGNFSEFCYKMHLNFFSIFTIIKGDILLKPIIHIHMYFFFHHKHTFLTKGPYTKLLFWVTLPIQG